MACIKRANVQVGRSGYFPPVRIRHMMISNRPSLRNEAPHQHRGSYICKVTVISQLEGAGHVTIAL